MINEGFFQEMRKTAIHPILKGVMAGGAGAALGGGAAYAAGEHKRKKQLKQLADLFRQANMAENKILSQRAYQAGKSSK